MRIITLVLPVLVLGCGGATSRDVEDPASVEDEDLGVRYTAEDMVPRAVLSRGELTTSVDAKRYRAAAPIKTVFELTDRIIYFVGRLKQVPTDATIEVRWFLDSDDMPMLVSEIQGSDNFQFVASFSPQDDSFVEGSYSARVFVDDREVGRTSFVIGNPDPSASGAPTVSNIAFSTAVTGEMKPKKPKMQFDRGTRQLYVSFEIKGAERGSVVDVFWYRGEDAFHNSEIELSGNKRYAANVASPSGLPNGEYKVEIHLGSELLATKNVVIGKGGSGAAVDDIALGVALKENNMPKKRKKVFKRDTNVIQCGLRFVDLPPNSIIELQWFLVENDGETQVYTNRSTLSSGGSGTMGAAWEPNYALSKGDYKVVVLVNDLAMNETTFKVE